MTAARMVLAPIVGYYIFMDQPVVAAGLFATAAALDYFDGVIARRCVAGSHGMFRADYGCPSRR